MRFLKSRVFLGIRKLCFGIGKLELNGEQSKIALERPEARECIPYHHHHTGPPLVICVLAYLDLSQNQCLTCLLVDTLTIALLFASSFSTLPTLLPST